MSDVFRTDTHDEGPLTVTVEYHYDDNPDTSWLGEYTDKWQPGAIDRLHTGNWTLRRWRREYRYFIPGVSVEEHRRGLSRLGYAKHEAWVMANRYTRADYERMEALNRGDWHFIGIVVKVTVEAKRDGFIFDPVEVGYAGLWGIESDSDEDYIADTVAGLIEDAKAMLPTAADRLEAVAWTVRDATA